MVNKKEGSNNRKREAGYKSSQGKNSLEYGGSQRSTKKWESVSVLKLQPIFADR